MLSESVNTHPALRKQFIPLVLVPALRLVAPVERGNVHSQHCEGVGLDVTHGEDCFGIVIFLLCEGVDEVLDVRAVITLEEDVLNREPCIDHIIEHSVSRSLLLKLIASNGI